ncbi:MAG: hypothetical protein JNM94_16280 [Phycisphaerae bacterium]|nr:hypothetical protein [Phycisphaerae bacterium]
MDRSAILHRRRLASLVIAVALAATIVGYGFGQSCPKPGSCLTAHQNPGCENTDCCMLVCSADPFCCQASWDSMCADEGWAWCAASCGGPLSGDCLSAHEDPACYEPTCCDTVCQSDAFCCEQMWDDVCVDEAFQLCVYVCGGPLAGDCLNAHADPFCWEESCCNVVCDADPYCCNTEWDQTCADEAFDFCTACGSPSAGSCYASHGPNCSDEVCCNAVCTLDSYCCLVAWDGYCVDGAQAICAPCGASGALSCFAPHGPGCDEVVCCTTICAVDPFCCTTAWDTTCVATATDVCGGCGNPAAGSCLTEHDTPFCEEPNCCAAVCIEDDYCCTAEWDAICAIEAAEICGGCGAAEAPSCLFAHASSGCDDLDCCALICGLDAFCCEVAWDAVCVDAAIGECALPPCYGVCDGDLDANGVVDAADIALVLGSWGSSQCGDIDRNGIVNGGDLAALLGNWGACD